MRTVLFIGIALLLLSSGRPDEAFSQYHFGVGLGTGPHSTLYSLFIVKENEGRIISVKGITSEQFILQATGHIVSRANPDSVDFFEHYQVSSCVKMIDESGQERRPCDPFSNLWKLRFNKFPLHMSEPKDLGEGWAKHQSKPSDGQLKILNTYGIKTFTGMCYGENAFRLLRDINDPMWVQAYRAAE